MSEGIYWLVLEIFLRIISGRSESTKIAAPAKDTAIFPTCQILRTPNVSNPAAYAYKEQVTLYYLRLKIFTSSIRI